jgi:6-phosphogluconate dehydrogenase
MEIGFVGLGRMGFNMSVRLMRAGHRVTAVDRSPERVEEIRAQGGGGVGSNADLVGALAAPRAIWMMIPAGAPVDQTIEDLAPRLARGDVLIDGGNSNYRDSRARAQRLEASGIHYLDVGTSGGIWGLELGYCMMVGGEAEAVARIRPALDALAPKEGWLHVGASGAGHFSKMIHNGIEYGMMAAYAEGFEVLKSSEYGYDLARLSHLWNQGSVIRSWLLELAERAFEKDAGLERIRGWVEDSGEGRWTVMEAIDRGVPAPVLALSLFERFRSRQEDSFRDRVIAALRAEFGGHAVKEKAHGAH